MQVCEHRVGFPFQLHQETADSSLYSHYWDMSVFFLLQEAMFV